MNNQLILGASLEICNNDNNFESLLNSAITCLNVKYYL